MVLGGVSLSLQAQDDMYFTPSKQKKQTQSSIVETPIKERDISPYEYNRRMRSSYQKIGTDSVGNDIIEFEAGDGVYPELDTLQTNVDFENFYNEEDDYRYSRRMGLYDGFYGWYDPVFYPYHAWYWDPWYFPYSRWSSWYGWYDPWYDPWYYGWYSPWYYSGWYSPWGYGGYAYGWGYYPSHHHWDHGGGRGDHGIASKGSVYHGRGYSTASRGTFGGSAVSRNGSSFGTTNRSSVSYSDSGFGGSRSSSSVSTPSRAPSSGSIGGGGSFGGGGSRSGGGFSGGGHSSGSSRSGSFGGRR